MKMKAEYIFDGPTDMVWEAREKRFENPEKFPELQKHVELDRKEEGDKIYSKREIELASSVPKALQAVLKPDMLKCVDNSVYDLKEGTHKWDIKPKFKTSAFTCTGWSKYTDFEENGEKKTKREIVLEVKVKMPVVGKMAEQFILDAYKKNLKKDNDTIQKMIRMMKEEQG